MAVRKIMRPREVAAAMGRGLSTLYADVADGYFPPPIKLVPGGRASGWYEDVVEAVQKGEWKPQSAEPQKVA